MIVDDLKVALAPPRAQGAAPALELRSYAGPPRLPLAPGNQRHPHVLPPPQPIFGGRRRSHPAESVSSARL